MMRLLRVELARFRSRRINQMAVLGILAVVLVMLFGTWQSSKPPSAADMEWIQPQYEESVKDWEANGEQYVADCLASEKMDRENNNPEADYGCDRMAPDIRNWSQQSPPFSDRAASVLPSIGMLLIFAAFAMGVSFIAAEYSSGAIGNWLTFEPRRGRVYGTKLGASGISVLPVGLLFGVVVVGGAWLANSLNDNVGTVTGETWRDVGQSGIRVLVLTAVFAMFGVALGAIVRHTAAALGIVVGYFIVFEGIIGGIFNGLQPWLLRLNLQAVLENGATYGALECAPTDTAQQVCITVTKVVSLSQGVVVLSVVVVVVVLVAALVFRRRDVN